MKVDVLTIFPRMFDSYFNESILKRARAQGLLDLRVHDLRDWAEGRHKKVDDKPYGGGPGMVMAVGPFHRALKALKISGPRGSREKSRTILLSAKGKRFVHADALRLAKYDRLVFLCGRYEGVDERVAEHLVDEELSIGDFVLTGGELAAMVVIDAAARHVPGVLGKQESLTRESHSEPGVTEHPQYTRPEVYVPAKGKTWKVPPEVMSGNHAAIEAWRVAQSNNASDVHKLSQLRPKPHAKKRRPH